MMPFTHGQKVLELGGGERPLFRPNLDVRKLPEVDIVVDFCEKLPINDESYDGIYSSYVLEHISWRKVRGFISEMFRILRPGGVAFIITANLKEQAKILADKSEWTDTDVCMLFGDQNYDGRDWRSNSHCCGFSPKTVIEAFRGIGFDDVFVIAHPNCKTDMIIEARKASTGVHPNPNIWSKHDRKIAYDMSYFDGGANFGGYLNEGYRDFPIHWFTARNILERKPASVLEIGAARGYVLKKIEDAGIRVAGMDVSDHCYHTRVVNDIIQWDITETPWPFPSKSFDLCLSMAVLEHIPESKLAQISSEMERVCERGLHGISFNADDFDKTHVTMRPKLWWTEHLPKSHEVVDKEDLERGPADPPMDAQGMVKLNIGSFTTMFHYGWINMDVHDLCRWASSNGYVYKIYNAKTPLPYEDNSVDMIYTCHFLEHLSYEDGAAFLKECHRAMRPGGKMRLIMPDIKKLAKQYLDDELGQYDCINRGCAYSGSSSGKFWNLVFPGHSSIYDAKSTIKVLKESGFSIAKEADFRKSDCKQMLAETLDLLPTLSLFVDAVK